VWACKFSNDGTKLATGSKDGSLIVWDVNLATYELSMNKTYDDHGFGIGSLAWSPNSRYLIVCGSEDCAELWIWDVELKILKKRFNHNHDDSLPNVSWMPDGQHFVVGGIKGQFYYCVSYLSAFN
jgi:WD40 repeat protein